MGRAKKSAKVAEKSSVSPDLAISPVLETPQSTPDTSPKAKKMLNGNGATDNGVSDKLEKMDVNESITSRKRGRPQTKDVAAKKIKIDVRHDRGTGHVLTVGQGDTGQLGLGEDVMEKSRFALVSAIKDAVDVVAGGMHTLVLTVTGEVYSFGCNDEGALGRQVADEEECFTPGKVDIDGKVVQLTAGDSHSVALTEDGRVFAWGTFRDSSGAIGLTTAGRQKEPIQLLAGIPVKKVSSGADHIALLTAEGAVYTVGNSEQGQLGRLSDRFAHRGGRRGLEVLLTPEKLHLKNKSTVVTDVWANSYNTLVLSSKGEVFVMGLNNYNQMGLDTGLVFFMPTKSKSLSEKNWKTITLGQHHTLALDSDGKVFAMGRSEYGRLGLGDDSGDAKVPTAIPALKEKSCIEVGCGSVVSYAITEKGELYSWGMGTNGQLANGEDDDVTEPKLVKSKQLENRSVIAVSSGGQHTVILAKDVTPAAQ